jgi:glycosyltransferase involved in cell wall biosynthesis
VGSNIPAKRVDLFLKAIKIARDSNASVIGMVVGDGPQHHDLKAQAGDLGLLPHGVAFCGHRADVCDLLQRADLLVLTSDHEGFPNVILEAMATSLPVVTTPAGDAGCVVQDGRTGFVVPFDDATALAERILKLSLCADMRWRMGQAGRDRVQRHYSVDGLAPVLLCAYEKISSNLRSRGIWRGRRIVNKLGGVG